MRVQQIRGRAVVEKGLPLIGRVFKGTPKKTNANGNLVYGSDLKYFRVEFEESPAFDKARALAVWTELYGEQPSVLRNAQFVVDNAELIFTSANEQWATSAKGLQVCNRRCDGCTISLDRSGQEVSRVEKACQYPNCKCALTVRLTFWLPEFSSAAGIAGQFQLTTHSRTDYEGIQSILDLATNSIGRLRGLAFVLYRKDKQLLTPDGAPVVKSIVHLDFMEAAAQQAALAASNAVLALPAPATTPTQAATPKKNIIAVECSLHAEISVKAHEGVTWYGFTDTDGRMHVTSDHDLVEAVIEDVRGLAVGETHSLKGYNLIAKSTPPAAGKKQWSIIDLSADIPFQEA